MFIFITPQHYLHIERVGFHTLLLCRYVCPTVCSSTCVPTLLAHNVTRMLVVSNARASVNPDPFGEPELSHQYKW